MSYFFIRLFNAKPMQNCSKLRAAQRALVPSIENITSVTCRTYFKFCSRQSENCQNISHRGSLTNVLLQLNRKLSSQARSSEQVILYTYSNLKFLKVVNLFGYSFAAFWFFTSYQFITMRIVPQSERRTRNLPWFARFDLVSSPVKKLMAAFLSAFVGCAVLGGAWMYSLRSVGKVVLGKGGKTATFTTFSPRTFSMSNIVRANISEISCQGHRSVNNVVPIKLKGRWMHYLVSNEGTYHNGPLFDRTVGLCRTF